MRKIMCTPENSRFWLKKCSSWGSRIHGVVSVMLKIETLMFVYFQAIFTGSSLYESC